MNKFFYNAGSKFASFNFAAFDGGCKLCDTIVDGISIAVVATHDAGKSFAAGYDEMCDKREREVLAGALTI